MKRDSKCIKKMINKKIREIGELSNEIIKVFKRIYFLKKLNIYHNPNINYDNIEAYEHKENPFELKYEGLKKIIKANLEIFESEKKMSIKVKTELVPFLRSCGNVLSKEEIEDLVFIIGNKETVTLDDLYNVCGFMLNMREKRNNEIIKDVFDYYYDENKDIYGDKMNVDYKNIEVFIERNNEHFKNNQIKQFILHQCYYLGDSFTLDAFISIISTQGQYYPF